MSHPVETELAARLHRDFRRWAGNIGCGDHDPDTWNAIAETASEYLQLKAISNVHAGDSALTRDLVWCGCGRGLSLTGKWVFCPTCGRQIDQESYHSACGEALKNGAVLYRAETE